MILEEFVVVVATAVAVIVVIIANTYLTATYLEYMIMLFLKFALLILIQKVDSLWLLNSIIFILTIEVSFSFNMFLF